MSENYNGWKNRETWAVKLHLDNDQGLYDEYHEIFKQICKEHKLGTRRWRYADALQEWVGDMLSAFYWKECGGEMPEWAIYMQDDVGSLWRVNWDEIAHSIVRDIEDEIEYTSTFNVEQKEIKNGNE